MKERNQLNSRKLSWRHKFPNTWTVCFVFLPTIVAVLTVPYYLHENWELVKSSTIYDWIRGTADPHEVRILLADLKYDENGSYTGEIERILREDGKQYRKLLRTWEIRGEEDRENEEERIKRIMNLLEIHNSEVFIHGEVGATGKEIRLRITMNDGTTEAKTIEIGKAVGTKLTLTNLLDEWLTNAIQARVDSLRLTGARPEEHLIVEQQVDDLLDQLSDEDNKRQARFQAAFMKHETGFLYNDIEKRKKAVEDYVNLLREAHDSHEEGIIRINIAAHFQFEGMRRDSTSDHERAIAEFQKAEKLFAEVADIDRWAKVRNGITVSEWQAYLLDEKVERLIRSILRQQQTLEDAGVILSADRGWQTNQEGLNAAILLAEHKGLEDDVSELAKNLEENRDVWWEFVKQSGQTNNPWALAPMMCDADMFLTLNGRDMDNRRTTQKDQVEALEEEMQNQIYDVNRIKERRERLENWIEKREEQSSESEILALSTLIADLRREEGLKRGSP